MTPEWLEADGAGGFASGTANGIRTRRYHALLLIQAPTGRILLVNGIEAWIDLPTGPVPISSQLYAPNVTHPDGATRIASFTAQPWPTWTYALPDGTTLTQEILVAGGQTCLRWTRNSATPATLHIRPLLSGRDYHALHHENPAFNFQTEQGPGWVRWRPYPGLPPITAWGGDWTPGPDWFRQFLYTTEQDRGLDCIEDLAAPGTLSWDLARPATLALRPDTAPAWPVSVLMQAEAAERAAQSPIHRAALQYIARTPTRCTVLAGFPWFTDWGRDTFIALRGLLLAPTTPTNETTRDRLARQAQTQTNRDLAEQILLAWAAHVDQGMLPNRFPDNDAPPEFNAVDASLWFIIAVHDLLKTGAGPRTTAQLQAACTAIIQGYRQGTRYNIHMDVDALISAGAEGVQLTWMDAKVGDWVVTPRRGKPVEIQALWINALRIAAAWDQPCAALAAQATTSFLTRFPDPATGGLRDLVDGDPNEENRIRPNQIFAIGGLPHSILPQALARSTLDLVERTLLTPLGLRTLAPQDPAYRPRYQGSVHDRDGAYHQGTAWPWLLGPFVEAWLRIHQNKAEARQRFLPPLYQHLNESGLGHISEVVDGDAPHTPGGCPFQAWSLGELLRIEALLSEAQP